jgi:hypothetical protein
MNTEELLDKEIKVLAAMRSTLIEIVRDTMTKPGMKHPLEEKTRMMITDCLNLVASRQIEIEKELGKFSDMKPKFADESTQATFSVDDLKKTIQ